MWIVPFSFRSRVATNSRQPDKKGGDYFSTKQSRRGDYDTPLFRTKPTGAETLRCPEIQICTLRKTKIPASPAGRRSTQIRTRKLPIP